MPVGFFNAREVSSGLFDNRDLVVERSIFGGGFSGAEHLIELVGGVDVGEEVVTEEGDI